MSISDRPARILIQIATMIKIRKTTKKDLFFSVGLSPAYG